LKRRTEFAEVVLADFYQAQRIIDEARSPGSMGNEGSTRPKVAGETEDEERTLNAYFVTAERLNNRREFFAQHSNPRFPGARGWAPCPLVSHPSGRIPCNDAVSIAARQPGILAGLDAALRPRQSSRNERSASFGLWTPSKSEPSRP
jgi:hypothetical protein